MAESNELSRGLVRNAILIAGPTASGKSALALELARRTGGVIINADSMQVYSVLRILTARPDEADMARAPHRLYGHVSPAVSYSTGQWLADAGRLFDDEVLQGRRPIFVGGTGLYFRALTQGLSAMPDIPDTIREHWRERLRTEGPLALHAILQEKDPDAASGIEASDGQRLVRALEVFDASGRSIREWQAANGPALVDGDSSVRLVLDPDRSILVRRIDERFDRMISDGALEEVRDLLAMDLDPALPAMKAIGVRELRAVIEENADLHAAISRCKIATRQYAKRQMTWFRHQMDDSWTRVSFASERALSEVIENLAEATERADRH